ncbi:flavin oxidoreductase [Iodidimonas gelatinilytica]|uniref:Flavin oxidoreductase n=1 Tax=Iodidimonas gelatinilytica TaxID=1236966 RepID=A0A5A7MQA7_9PROT|nr:flavin reductase family protein [Iodidimonas gelatinilytica]GEQ98087.1 flavin oxidoreductase [Iodidimonas gelatinilytica]GEQ99790.1 flavin oxidoreductase [Iodidimonas gelatinilytica]
MNEAADSLSFAFDDDHGLPVDEDRRAFRIALGRYPTGVAVVTALDMAGQAVGITINSFASVSLDPPLVLWSIEERSAYAPAFIEADAYAISVLAADQSAVAQAFAGPGEHRFRDCETQETRLGIPVPKGALAVFECQRFALYPGGDHRILLGRVERVTTCAGEPLVFHEGALGGLG